MTMRATYHLDVVVPIISNLIPRDSGGRVSIPAQVTVSLN